MKRKSKRGSKIASAEPSRADEMNSGDNDNRDELLHQASQLDNGLLPGELHYRLIERFSPSSILVNSARKIVHLSESAGRFLQVAAGEPMRSLMSTVHPMLRVELRAAIYAASRTQEATTAFRVPVETGDALFCRSMISW